MGYEGGGGVGTVFIFFRLSGVFGVVVSAFLPTISHAMFLSPYYVCCAVFTNLIIYCVLCSSAYLSLSLMCVCFSLSLDLFPSLPTTQVQ